ncbi:MAG: sigma-70 family RNA polymerase sigma factor [Deltaproteobacteria bacterium]|nr:sigma-70 family RNA polymerase sigma factor [Deltaproteobacteria bacterium]
MSNEALDQAMARYAEGDEPAFAVLYDELSSRLFSFLIKQTRDQARAEDLLQQTFLQLHRSRGHFKPGSPALPWALAIARRLAIDASRRARFSSHESEEAIAEAVGGDPLPDAVLSARQLHGRFQEELAKLPESQRNAFVMIREEGLSTAEAAAVLGTTVSGVKLRAHRAYSALRRALGEVFDRPEKE